MGILDRFRKPKVVEAESEIKIKEPQATIIQRPIIFQTDFNGDKFLGSFGITKDYAFIDYWTLRKRSVQLFEENPYFRGLIRRLVTNEINTGLRLDAAPKSEILNIDEDSLQEWADKHETLWQLWSEDPSLCDWHHENTFGELHALARYTAIVSGDVLKITRINQKTGLPQIEIIDGQYITDPGVEPRKGNTIEYGIELDSNRRHVAYWVEDKNEQTKSGKTHRRIPVYGEKSGRRISKLIYGTDKLIGRLRGIPLAALVLTKLKDLDRASDAELRATLINSMIAGVTQREQGVIASNAIGRGAQAQATPQNGYVSADENVTINQKYRAAFQQPGMWVEELSPGETLNSFSTARPNVNFAKYEESILNLLCWSLELPPEIGRLLFTNSFSASRQANNEFQVYLKKANYKNANDFCRPIYEQFTTYAALTNQTDMQGFIEARISGDWKKVNAWLCSEWTGISRPSIDILKDVNAGEKAVANGFSTLDDQARKISGKTFRTVAQKLKREKEYADKLGISLNMFEDNMGVPLPDPNNPQQIQDQQLQAQNARMIFQIAAKLENIESDIEEIKEASGNS